VLHSGLYCAAPPVLRIDCAVIGILRSFLIQLSRDRPITPNRYHAEARPSGEARVMESLRRPNLSQIYHDESGSDQDRD